MALSTSLWIYLFVLVTFIYAQNNGVTGPTLSEDIAELKAEIARVEEKNAEDLKETRAALRAEMEKSLNISLREVIGKLLKENSFDDRLNSEILSEMNRMKKRLKRAERKLRAMKRHVDVLKVNVTAPRETVPNETTVNIDYLENRQNLIVDYLKGSRDACLRGNNMFPQHMSRLLLTTYNKGITDSHILDMQGHTLSPYPYLKVYDIISTVYVPSRKQIVFSRYFPDGIYSINFNDTVITTFNDTLSSFGLALDEDREIIFMTTHKPAKTVSRMTTSGNDITVVASLDNHGNNPNGIAIDSARRMIYVSTYDSIYSLDYDGNAITRLYYKGLAMVSLTLDLDRDFVYFSDKGHILRRSLVKGEAEMVMDIDHFPRSIRYYNDTVYISCKDTGDILALDVKTDEFKKIAQIEAVPMITLIP